MEGIAALLVSATLLLTDYTVTDGDTLKAPDVRVRLWGIDAPEMNQLGGKQAKAALKSITKGQDLSCRVKGADRYGRIVARCDLPNGKDIACLMVQFGHASDWPKYSKGYYAKCNR